jgi:hypothetical protein
MPERVALPIAFDDSDSLDHILPQLRPLAGAMSELIPDPENARKHDLRNLRMIAESLAMFGQRTPLTVNRKTTYIQKGNGTYMAAKMLGWSQIAWVWTEDEREESLAYGLIDNRTSDTSAMDYSQAGKSMRTLKAADYPLLKFWNEEEAMPIIRGEFQPAVISEEKFDPGLQRGRAITKITASERIEIDKAIAFIRSQSRRSVSEGKALVQICGEFLALHINEIDNAVQNDMLMSLSIFDDEEDENDNGE